MSNSNTVKNNNHSLFLIGGLFGLIMAAGVGSGILGYTLGYESLRGINLPEVNPTKKITSKQKSEQKKQAPSIVSEKEILTKVDKFIQLQNQNNKKTANKTQTETNKNTEANTKDNQSFIKHQETSKVTFPIRTSSQGVTLEITKITKQDEDLVLEVNLVNKSKDTVQFLYSFLSIKNEKDRLLNSLTEGLPQEISNNGEKVSGRVTIPLALVGDSRELSLTLKDYPDEIIQLVIPKISLDG